MKQVETKSRGQVVMLSTGRSFRLFSKGAYQTLEPLDSDRITDEEAAEFQRRYTTKEAA